jgi:hypothetical protein
MYRRRTTEESLQIGIDEFRDVEIEFNEVEPW